MLQCHKHTRGHASCFTVLYTEVGKIVDQGRPAEDRLSSVPPKPNAVAIEAQASIVKKFVLAKPNGYKYVALVGMGGIGKTTLAMTLINDTDIKKEFPTRGFVTISEHPVIEKCQKNIWSAVVNSQNKEDFLNPEDGKWRLQSALEHKRVFLVLDDVWDEKHMDDLDVVSADSLLLITSRNRHVGTCLGAQCYDVEPLNDAQSMDLFCEHAFGDGKPSKWQKEFVDDIVKECSGVPLALVVMGRQVRTHSCKGDTAARPSFDEKESGSILWQYSRNMVLFMKQCLTKSFL